MGCEGGSAMGACPKKMSKKGEKIALYCTLWVIFYYFIIIIRWTAHVSALSNFVELCKKIKIKNIKKTGILLLIVYIYPSYVYTYYAF